MTTKPGTLNVGRRAAENVLHSVRFTADQGAPINTLITISFEALGIEESVADRVFQELHGRVLRAWRHLLHTNRVPRQVVGAYCHANPAGSRHVHWLAHVPPVSFEIFEAVVSKFLRKVVGRFDLGDALHIKRVDTPGSVAKYVLRGIDPYFADYLHIEAANEGFVLGRRTGVSRSISKAARKRAGWSRKRRRQRS
jgi:hypothetical protein